jgi:hypothetical protein
MDDLPTNGWPIVAHEGHTLGRRRVAKVDDACSQAAITEQAVRQNYQSGQSRLG